MPEDIKEALTRIAATLPPVDWPEPAAIRHRGTARRRRGAVLAAASVVAVLAVGGLAVRPGLLTAGGGFGLGSTTSTGAGRCSNGLVRASVNLPERNEITINVYNGTLIDGLATEVGNELRRLEFNVGLVGNDVQAQAEATDQVAVLRFGPSTVGAAFVVLAYFPGARMEFNLYRTEDVVDVVVGDQFVALPTVTEVNRNIAANGRPTAPPGTCVGD